MTKYSYPAPGQVVLFMNLFSVHNGRTFKTSQTGTNSMQNVAMELEGKIRNAVQNAKMKHLAKVTATTNPAYNTVHTVEHELLDYDIRYFKDLVNTKRVNIKGKYYSVATDKKGKRIGKPVKWRKSEVYV